MFSLPSCFSEDWENCSRSFHTCSLGILGGLSLCGVSGHAVQYIIGLENKVQCQSEHLQTRLGNCISGNCISGCWVKISHCLVKSDLVKTFCLDNWKILFHHRKDPPIVVSVPSQASRLYDAASCTQSLWNTHAAHTITLARLMLYSTHTAPDSTEQVRINSTL